MKKTILMLALAAMSTGAMASKISAEPFCAINDHEVIAHTVVEERWTGKNLIGEPVSQKPREHSGTLDAVVHRVCVAVPLSHSTTLKREGQLKCWTL